MSVPNAAPRGAPLLGGPTQGDHAVSIAKLSCSGLSVSFGSTRALSGINLDIGPGEIVGLLGHNGAGKSTFVNAVTGAITGYSGRISIGGKTVAPGTGPRELTRMGISVLFQEPALIGSLSIMDNLFLGHHIKPDLSAAKAALDKVGAKLDVQRPVSSLPLGQRQLVGLARGLLGGQPEVLLLDEPTAALGKDETDALHRLIRQFSAQGTAIVYVSHRLRDIFDVCTRIVVLQQGHLELDSPVANLTMPTLTSALARGGETRAADSVVSRETGPEVLRVTEPHGSELTFAQGEIVGLFGMAAGLQFELLASAFGQRGTRELVLKGEKVSVRRPRDAIGRGIHLVPADRERDGLLGNLSAIDNVFLPWMGHENFRSRAARSRTYEEIRGLFGISGPPGDASITAFSGGNRQKHLLARWTIPIRPSILLLSQPTQGVDVQAKRDIREVVTNLAAQGTTVLVASAEADEISALCSRSYVFGATRCHQIQAGEHFDARLVAALLEDRSIGD